MINLQIAGNKASSSSSTANTAQASPEAGALAVEPFACLLAQQLDEAGMLAADATGIVTDDALNQIADIDDDPDDSVNVLAAIALAEARLQKSAGGAPKKGEIEIDSLPSGTFRRTEMPAACSDKFLRDVPVADKIAASAVPAALIEKSQTGAGIVESEIAPAMPVTQENSQFINRTADSMQTINAPLGDNGWSNEFSQKISWMASQQHQVAELHLNPPNLGPLDVMLKISDHHATALFTSAHGAVRDAVETALPKLREMLADNGITLGNATVSDQPPRDRGTEGFMNHDSGTAIWHGAPENHSETSETVPAATHILHTRRHNGMVDTFA